MKQHNNVTTRCRQIQTKAVFGDTTKQWHLMAGVCIELKTHNSNDELYIFGKNSCNRLASACISGDGRIVLDPEVKTEPADQDNDDDESHLFSPLLVSIGMVSFHSGSFALILKEHNLIYNQIIITGLVKLETLTAILFV